MSLFAILSLLITLAAVASYLNYRYIRLPTTIGVMLVALVASIGVIALGPLAEGFREAMTAVVNQIDFSAAVLHALLAFLLFAGAIHVDFGDLRREWPTISLLAILGTLLSTAIVGLATYGLLRAMGMPVPVVDALLFGALISPTDPIAVLAIMESVGAPRRLEVQMSGESLFNDGVGVVIFLVLLELSGGSAHDFGATDVAILILKEVGGAVVLGLAAGLVTYHMLKRVDEYQVEVLLTLALAMGAYALADALHLSAPIAVVVAGVFIGNRGRAFAMSPTTEKHVDKFWELIDEILNAVLFLLIGLELLVIRGSWSWFVAGAIAVPIVLIARWACVAGLLWPLDKVVRQSRGAIPVLTWGGLRGGISVALALSLPAGDSRGLLLTMTYCVVVFSILVQGLTVGRLIKKTTGPEPHEVSEAPATA